MTFEVVRPYLIGSQSVLIAISLGLVIFFMVKGKKTELVSSYIFSQASVTFWILAYTLELLFAKNASERMLFIRFEYIGLCFFAFYWVVFTLIYSGNRSFLTPRNRIFIALLPISCYVVVFSTDYHRLFYTSTHLGATGKGVLFWIYFALFLLGYFMGLSLLLRVSFKKIGQFSSCLILIGTMAPVILGLLAMSPLLSPGYDLTPVGFLIALIFFSMVIFRDRFLNMLPMEYPKIFDNLAQSVVLVDKARRIFDYNKSFASMFEEYFTTSDHDEHWKRFVNYLKHDVCFNIDSQEAIGFLESEIMDRHYQGEIKMEKPQERYYYITVQPYQNNYRLQGIVVSFKDISDYKRLFEELSEKNREINNMNEKLLRINQQLSDYNQTVEELAVTKERNRIARDAHDTLGQTMTILIALLERSCLSCLENPSETRTQLEQAVQVAKGGLRELRRSISGLTPPKLDGTGLTDSLRSIFTEYRASGLEVEFISEGWRTDISAPYSDALFRVCQEALTNSVRHGKATKVSVILRLRNGRIQLYIFDNGRGCREIKKGFGLAGMEQRIRELGGEFEYGSDGENGFNIRAALPLGN